MKTLERCSVNALCKHGVRNLQEAGNVGATLQVGVVLLGRLDRSSVDILHDRLQGRVERSAIRRNPGDGSSYGALQVCSPQKYRMARDLPCKWPALVV